MRLRSRSFRYGCGDAPILQTGEAETLSPAPTERGAPKESLVPALSNPNLIT
jgi:hypothetical protein